MNDSRSLADLHPTLASLCRRHLAACAAAGIRVLVTFTYRSPATQTALYARGRTTAGQIVTNAKAGDSFHNYGLAYDLVPLKDNGAADWDASSPAAVARWHRIGELGKALGMRWGGDFHHNPDMPHFEWSGALSLAELKKGKRP